MPRRRTILLALLITIAVGVASRTSPVPLHPLLGKYLGDVLWGLMFVLIVLLIRPRTSPIVAGLIGFAIAAGTECLKLAHAPWLDELRTHRIPGMLLGTFFRPSNFLWYAIGAAAGAVAVAWSRRTRRA